MSGYNHPFHNLILGGQLPFLRLLQLAQPKSYLSAQPFLCLTYLSTFLFHDVNCFLVTSLSAFSSSFRLFSSFHLYFIFFNLVLKFSKVSRRTRLRTRLAICNFNEKISVTLPFTFFRVLSAIFLKILSTQSLVTFPVLFFSILCC